MPKPCPTCGSPVDIEGEVTMSFKPIKAPTVTTHPLGEILAKKLFGIESVPKAEQSKMVVRAIKAAVKYHERCVGEIVEKGGE